MTDDFGGELEDMSEVDSDDQSSEEESEFDETLGDLDARDQSVINEKIRDGSHPPADSDEHDVDENHSTNPTESSEVMAKEGENTRKPEDLGEVSQEDSMKEEINPQDERNSDPFIDGAPMEQVPEADTLELPDNINLDDKNETEDEHDVQEDYEFSEDQAVDPEDIVAEDMDDRLSLSSGPEPENGFDDEIPGRTQPEPIQDTLASYPDLSPGGEKSDSIDVINSESRVPGSSGDSGNSQNGDNKLSTQEKEDYDAKCEFRSIPDYQTLTL
jgi:midasin